MKQLTTHRYLIALVFLTGLLACTETPPEQAAPLNDRPTLEKLADSYRFVADQFPVSPDKLAPKMRRKFVEQVFSNAGFGYRETMISLSRIDRGQITQLHRDMQELLFLPHHQLGKDSLGEIYSEEEIALIDKIDLLFK